MSMSPLPPGTIERQPQNTLGKRLRTAGLVAVVPVLLSLIFLGPGPTVMLVIVALVVLVVVAKDRLLAAMRWDGPILQLAASPYALGSRASVVYRRRPKRVVDIAACRVECLLVCEERVTYTQGTDTRTDTRRVYESRSVGTGEGTADGLVADIEFHVSANLGAPSFRLPNNEVVWFVEIGINGPRLPRDSHTFVIDVAPVLDPAHRVGVQDT